MNERIEQMADLFRQRDAVQRQIEALLGDANPLQPVTGSAKRGQKPKATGGGTKVTPYVCTDCQYRGTTTESLLDATCGQCNSTHVAKDVSVPKAKPGARPCGCGPMGRHSKTCTGVGL